MADLDLYCRDCGHELGTLTPEDEWEDLCDTEPAVINGEKSGVKFICPECGGDVGVKSSEKGENALF